MEQPVLAVKNLRTSFYTRDGVFPAVDGVTFTLRKGQTLGIVGESGCGKSVTSLSILKLLPPRTGVIEKGSSVKLKGEELTGKTNREMCRIRGNEIAMIFQDSMTSLNPVMTIERQMTEPFRIHQKLSGEEARQRALDMLRRVGIPSPETHIREYPHQLSGGMRQRVMIAMALSCNPEVLIADEPTTALDVTIQAQILELMRQLRVKTGTSIMLITHDLGVVAEMADDIIVMYAGHVVEYAGKRSIFKDPLHPYTRGLLASIPRLDRDAEKLYTIEGVVPSLRDMPRGCRFCSRCDRRMERCETEPPGLYRVGERQVRCFRYAGGAQGDDGSE